MESPAGGGTDVTTDPRVDERAVLQRRLEIAERDVVALHKNVAALTDITYKLMACMVNILEHRDGESGLRTLLGLKERMQHG